MDEKIIAQIKYEIKKQDLTHTKLAARANISRVSIKRLLTPDYDPTIKLVTKLARALGKSIKIELE